MGFISLGRKEKNFAVEASTPGKQKMVIQYPNFNVNDIQLPVTEKDVGKTINAVVQLRVNRAGAEIDAFEGNKKRYRAEFSVMGIAFPGKKKVSLSSLSNDDLDNLEKKEYERTKK